MVYYYYSIQINQTVVLNHINMLFNFYSYSQSQLIDSDIIFILIVVIALNFFKLLLNLIDLKNFL